jgi:hypothetical protein
LRGSLIRFVAMDFDARGLRPSGRGIGQQPSGLGGDPAHQK